MSMYLVFCTLVLMVVLTSCETDADRIREANEAASGQGAFDPDTLGGTISVFDLRDGDCFNGARVPLGETIDVYDVELVACTGGWDYRVLNTFNIDQDGPYPGEQYFDNQANVRCHRLFDFFIFPLDESWELAIG